MFVRVFFQHYNYLCIQEVEEVSFFNVNNLWVRMPLLREALHKNCFPLRISIKNFFSNCDQMQKPIWFFWRFWKCNALKNSGSVLFRIILYLVLLNRSSFILWKIRITFSLHLCTVVRWYLFITLKRRIILNPYIHSILRIKLSDFDYKQDTG